MTGSDMTGSDRSPMAISGTGMFWVTTPPAQRQLTRGTSPDAGDVGSEGSVDPRLGIGKVAADAHPPARGATRIPDIPARTSHTPAIPRQRKADQSRYEQKHECHIDRLHPWRSVRIRKPEPPRARGLQAIPGADISPKSASRVLILLSDDQFPHYA